MTTTLFQSPLRCLAPLRRAPFWAQALALCALFAVAGVAVVDDYGVAGDEIYQRRTAATVADYALGASEELPPGHDRYYGVAFEMPLLLIERALGLQEDRHVYLTRHLLSHLFFIAGGFACGMLAYRTLGSRWIALFAMLLFLLHPRLYAHSFFNSKDIPFAAMFAVALYLTRRAFRKDTIGAFLLCGIGAGLAINLRVFALMLPPMILAMRALDLRQADRGERKHILLTGAAFLAATLGTAYIIHPYYWENPLRFFDGVRVLSQHPSIRIDNVFMGETYKSNAVPWNFIPVWFAITAPPMALALGAVGCAAVCWQGISRPLAALRCRETRFRVMLLGCFALPVVEVIALQSNTYNGWRHMYFLWAPFCLLAAIGLHHIANIRISGGVWKIGARLPGRVRGGGHPHMARRALAYGIAAVGLITTATAMAALHPHQQVYFNTLVDTKTPGALVKHYDIDYWQMAQRQSMEYLLALYPYDTLRVWFAPRVSTILPKSDRERIVHARAPDADFYFNTRYYYLWDAPDPPTLHSIEAYGNVISFIIAPNTAEHINRYRAEYDDVEANGDLLSRSLFDIYVHNGALYYLNANCDPLMADYDARAFLHIFPSALADLPADSRARGFENLDFWISGRDALFTHTAFFEGKCVVRRTLPDYPIARISTGELALGAPAWRVDIDMAAHAAAQGLYERVAAGDYGMPAARSGFDVYLRGNRLAYLKENCAPGDADADARFFLHIFPADAADLPVDWREFGFENLDFQFGDHGGRAGDKCVAERELPGYPIERIRTGQFVSGEGRLWGADFAAGR